MNYHHIFHSGNFADVFKHFILCLCLEKLQEKEAPFLVVDTHSGIGKYDLMSDAANKTGEYREGILRLIEREKMGLEIDPLFRNYLEIVERFNRPNLLAKTVEEEHQLIQTYPGSPQIIKQFLRQQDRAIFAELHTQDFVLLKRNFVGNKKITTLNQDGYLLLKSHLPPLIKRALILIDPPFEKENGRPEDFGQIVKYLAEAYKRFATGIYLVWYPIVEEKIVRDFHRQIRNLGLEKILISEILDPKIEGFKGCGMLIINAPWLLREKLQHALPLMLKYLGKDKARFRVED